MYTTSSFKYRRSRGGKTVISVKPSAFFALWPCGDTKCGKMEWCRALQKSVRLINIHSSKKRRRKEGENQTWHIPKGCPNLKHTNEVSFECTMEEFVGMAPELLDPSGQLQYFRVLPRCFYLQPLPDAFMSEGHFLESKSGDYVIFEVTSVLLSDPGGTSCLCEVPSSLFLTCNGEVVLFPFFQHHEIRIFTENHVIFPHL